MIRLAVCGWARVTAEGSDRQVGPIRAVWPGAPARVERADRASALALMVASEAVERASRPPGRDALSLIHISEPTRPY